MPRIFKWENRPKTVAQSAFLYLDIVFHLWRCCCFFKWTFQAVDYTS